MTGWRHLPVPVIPSSHFAQSAGHAWHVEPKNPGEHVSQEVPLNPVGQTHCPEAEHTPAPAHGGEQADDWMSSRAEGPDALEGNCDTSGTLSQKITRSLDDPVEIAAHTFEDSASEPADNEVLFSRVLGSCTKLASPEYLAWG